MASNRKFAFGPVAVAAVAGNLLSPPTVTGGVNAGSSPCYLLLQHLRVVNKTGSAVSMSLFLGATGASAAGTEFAWSATSVPAFGVLDFYDPGYRIESTQFLVGLASQVTALVISGSGEIGIA